MKKILNTRKKVIIAGVAAGAVVLGTGGAAYAYFATSGVGYRLGRRSARPAAGR